MYKACVIEENSLIRTVLRSVLRDNGFEVLSFCDIRERCPGFANSCPLHCPTAQPCHNLLILFNCERDSSGIEFLRFVDRYQCPCIHSFKVLYTCEEIREEHVKSLTNLHIQFVEKENPTIDMLPLIQKYKKWHLGKTVLL